MATGVYRTKDSTGAEYALADYGASALGELPRSLYEERGYKPPFDQLPTKEEYEARK